MNKINRILIFGILLVLTLSNVLALGVTPGKNTLIYPDELNGTFSFKVLNSENNDFGVSISVEGELKDYIQLSETSYQFSSEDFKEIFYSLDIPDSLSPGEHKAQIIVSEVKEGESNFGGQVGVITSISIFVPYPYKYVESTLNVFEMDNKTTLVIPVINRGKEKIDSVSAVIDIYTGGEKVDTISTSFIELESLERKELSVEWLPTFSLGAYQANVVLSYDDEQLNFVEDFEVGELSVDVFDLFVEDFELGNIVTLDVLVENKWSDPLKEVYANLVLNNQSGKVVDIKSAPEDIEARSKIRIPLYWDTAGVVEGKYEGQIIINYKDFSSAKDLKVEISQRGIGLELESGEFVLEERVSFVKTILIGLIIFGVILFILFKKFKIINNK
jgi:hypothetical protein